MARVCDRQGKTYLLRTFGNAVPNSGHEVWDVSDPAKPRKVSTVVTGLTSTHKNYWECDTGTAYLISGDLAKAGPAAARTVGLAHVAHDEDLRPERSREARLRARLRPGGPGAGFDRAGSRAAQGAHGPMVLGNRVYFAYGTSADGMLADRRPPEAPHRSEGADRGQPQRARDQPALHVAQLGRPHRVPVLRDDDRRLGARTRKGHMRDFVVLVSEAIANECREFRHGSFMIDITTETRPFGVATFRGAGVLGKFCQRGGRFGPHSSSESFAPIFYKKLVFIAYFNAGVRAVDIRNPYAPREAAFYIPATTEADRRALRHRTERGAARSRSRPTTSRPTSAASSTWLIAPTRGCTSCGSPGTPQRSSGTSP